MSFHFFKEVLDRFFFYVVLTVDSDNLSFFEQESPDFECGKKIQKLKKNLTTTVQKALMVIQY